MVAPAGPTNYYCNVDLALATCCSLPEPDVDEPLLGEALAQAGIDARVLAWDDPRAPFADARLTVLRSTWNYPLCAMEFLAWVDARGPQVLNPGRVVRWNAHKGYLEDLATDGLRTVPTIYLPRKPNPLRQQGPAPEAGAITKPASTLARLFEQANVEQLVVKPAVSAGSFATRRIHRSKTSAHEAWLAHMLGARDMMAQPYVRSVESHGERAIVSIAGELTHAVRKEPRFSGGHEHVSAALPVADDERRFAAQALGLAQARFPEVPLLYGRVDVARDQGGELMLMELELIEPSLFFAQCPEALRLFVQALKARL